MADKKMTRKKGWVNEHMGQRSNTIIFNDGYLQEIIDVVSSSTGHIYELACGHFAKCAPHMTARKVGTRKHCAQCEYGLKNNKENDNGQNLQ